MVVIGPSLWSPYLENCLSEYYKQQGFQSDLNCITVAFNLQKTIYHQLTRIYHDPDFSHFKHIQNAISPSVIWQYPATRSQLSLAHFVVKVVTKKSNRRDCVCHIFGCLYTNRTIHILSECYRTQPARNRLIDNIDSKFRAMISVPVSTMNSKYFTWFVPGKVSVKLNSDDPSTEIMDILLRYVKLAFTIYNGHVYI